jgi:LCP family protein required for cell wall assembly
MRSPVTLENPNLRPRTLYSAKRNQRGCAYTVLFALLILFATCTFCTISGLVSYVLFPPPPLDLLVLGLDARPNENYATRTDTIMLVGLQPGGFRISLLSLPRDLFITVPGYGSQRINTINVLGEQESEGGGITLLNASFEESFDIQPDRYIRLNFQGFVELVNSIGGVTIDVPYDIYDGSYPTMDGGTVAVSFTSGQEHMDGERALIYSRTRHSDDDYRRAERQQQVISAIASKLVNPLYWGPALRVLNQYTEMNLSLFDMARYAPLVFFRAGQFETLVVNREYILPGNGGAVPNYEKLAPWISERFD